MAEYQETKPRRSERVSHMPAYLADYYMGDNYPEESEKLESRWDRFIMERSLITGDINRNCDKANKLIKANGSRTTLEKIDARLEKSLADFKKLSDD